MKKIMYSETVVDPNQHCGCCTHYDDGDASVGIWGGCDNQDYHLPEDLEAFPEECEADQQRCGESPAHCLGFSPNRWHQAGTVDTYQESPQEPDIQPD